ncbi:Protein SPA2 [Fusarium oxysporum f. sp. albedinis]|nr:Protein SPA2 [Fusarium oxysporum f. sp. albedinis]
MFSVLFKGKSYLDWLYGIAYCQVTCTTSPETSHHAIITRAKSSARLHPSSLYHIIQQASEDIYGRVPGVDVLCPGYHVTHNVISRSVAISEYLDTPASLALQTIPATTSHSLLLAN